MNNMKKLFLPLLALALATMAFMSDNDLTIGDAMPMKDYKMKDAISNQEVTLQSLKSSKGLLVMFSCNTCPYVIKNQERTLDVMQYAKAKGLGVVVVNSNAGTRAGDDSPDAMKSYAKEQGYKWQYTIDNDNALADAFGATRTPECYLFDGEGTLAYHGAIDDSPSDAGAVSRHHLKMAVDELVAGKSVSVNTSRSVGCTIKRIKKG